MIILTVDEIIILHEKLINKTGGSQGIRDRNLIESAVMSVNGGFGDFERYSTIEEKAARLAYSIIRNHGFIDGNKRIGVFAMLMTLDLNNKHIEYSQDSLIKLGLEAAQGVLGYEEILAWILEKKVDKIKEEIHP